MDDDRTNKTMTDSQIIEIYDKLLLKNPKHFTDREVQYQKFFFAWGINCNEFRKKFCNKNKMPKDGYLYYNESEGREYAIEQEQWETTYEDAVCELASYEGVSKDEVINNYQGRYYIEPISEILNLESNFVTKQQ